ncbi:MAG: hypothetical protein FWF59_11610 [Turicibacter sp.]|nr:hypothetical protein [Turicibacter sp.]
MKKLMALSTMAVITLGLGACGTPGAQETEAPAPETEETVDVISAPTSGRGDTAEALVEGMSANGAWVFGMAADITVDGTLNIDGDIEMHSSSTQSFTGEIGRKIGLYSRDADRNPIGNFNLTVTDVIVINSPAMRFLSEGGYIAEVTADVEVNSNDLWLQDTQIVGNVVFANEEALASARATRWDETTETYEEIDFADAVTGIVTVAE